jgi:hypothetical protein
MRVMGDLAEAYSLDFAEATAAGLLHDATKDLTVESQLALAEETNIEFARLSEQHPILYSLPEAAVWIVGYAILSLGTLGRRNCRNDCVSDPRCLEIP